MAIGDAVDHRPLPATLVGGRYRLVEQIGRGGMGRVYRAFDDLLDRQVAVKLLDEPSLATADRGQVGLAEASAAARLAHPGIARLFDTGVDVGAVFIVMELVPGRMLRELLDERTTLPVADAVALATRLADALDYAHGRNVVHCDVSPHNIVVGPDGAPKLIDFGIARAASTTNSTTCPEIRGSAPYLAPEQVEGKPIDGRTDVYALGAVLFEMLTGRPPFEGPNVVAVVSQRLVCDPRSPRSLDPRIGLELERVVLTALAREPADRYATAGAFRDALQASAGAAARGTTVRVRQAPALGARELGDWPATPNAATGVTTRLRTPRSRPRLLVAVLALVGVIGAAAIVGTRFPVAPEARPPMLPTRPPITPRPPTPPVRNDTSVNPPPVVQPAVPPRQPLAQPVAQPAPSKKATTRPSDGDRRREPDRRRDRDDDDDDDDD